MSRHTTEQNYFLLMFWIDTILRTEWKHGDDPEEACRRIQEHVDDHLNHFDKQHG